MLVVPEMDRLFMKIWSQKVLCSYSKELFIAKIVISKFMPNLKETELSCVIVKRKVIPLPGHGGL
jgi:hypothetical protein